jgi:acetyl-CoA carboxylase carboxyl transferase subunit alpha
VVDEPPGGAHQDYDAAATLLAAAIRNALADLQPLTGNELVDDRYRRFRAMGAFATA